MRAGISFVDAAGARRNLEAEAPDGRSFDAMRAAARERWARAARARARSRAARRSTGARFYTALYHAFLHPNVFTDVDGRYLGADGRPHVAEGRTQYANFSSWDTYKAQNQLLAHARAAALPRHAALAARDVPRGGKLPRWGEQNIDAVAHVRRPGDPDDRRRRLPRAARATPSRPSCTRRRRTSSRRRPAELAQLGYLPMRPGTTLEYGGADFALALLARRARATTPTPRAALAALAELPQHPRPGDEVGPPAQRRRLVVRAVRARPDETGFQEGNAWQYSWLAPHDARGLFDRMGGDAAGRRAPRPPLHAARPRRRTARRSSASSTASTSTRRATSTTCRCRGCTRSPARRGARSASSREIRTLFRPTLDGLPGNDDLGSLSAFHVFSALGFGPVTPGAPVPRRRQPGRSSARRSAPPRHGVRGRGAGRLADRALRPARDAQRPPARGRRGSARPRLTRKGGTLRLEMGSRAGHDVGDRPRRPPAVGHRLAAQRVRLLSRSSTSAAQPTLFTPRPSGSAWNVPRPPLRKADHRRPAASMRTA